MENITSGLNSLQDITSSGNNSLHLFHLSWPATGTNSNNEWGDIYIPTYPVKSIHALNHVVLSTEQNSQNFHSYTSLMSFYHLSKQMPRERMRSRRGMPAVRLQSKDELYKYTISWIIRQEIEHKEEDMAMLYYHRHFIPSVEGASTSVTI